MFTLSKFPLYRQYDAMQWAWPASMWPGLPHSS